MQIDNKFNLEQTVYLKTDPEQLPHIVTAIRIEKGMITYEVSFMASHATYNDYELSSEKNVLIACGVDKKENV